MSGAGAGVMSLFRYISSELTRSYMLEHDQERYTSKREKMYTFMKIPRELEKFMSYGFFHCLDSFLFVFTFLPLRVLLACLSLTVRLVLASAVLSNKSSQQSQVSSHLLWYRLHTQTGQTSPSSRDYRCSQVFDHRDLLLRHELRGHQHAVSLD